MKFIIGPVIHRQKFTSPVKLEVRPIKTGFKAAYRGPFDWSTLLNKLVEDDERNRKVAEIADGEIRSGNSMLILSRRIEHLERIAGFMSEPCEILTGRRSKVDRKRLLAGFRSGDIPCLLSTQLADEALDVPRLNRICLTHPGKHEGRLVQQIGRTLRQHPDKKDAVIFDFVDDKRRPPSPVGTAAANVSDKQDFNQEREGALAEETIAQIWALANCGAVTVFMLEQEDVKRWQSGEKIQDVFTYLSPEEREILITGICSSECWNKLTLFEEE
jgi:superfamily II DNA or RNA helicase